LGQQWAFVEKFKTMRDWAGIEDEQQKATRRQKRKIDAMVKRSMIKNHRRKFKHEEK